MSSNEEDRHSGDDNSSSVERLSPGDRSEADQETNPSNGNTSQDREEEDHRAQPRNRSATVDRDAGESENYNDNINDWLPSGPSTAIRYPTPSVLPKLYIPDGIPAETRRPRHRNLARIAREELGTQRTHTAPSAPSSFPAHWNWPPELGRASPSPLKRAETYDTEITPHYMKETEASRARKKEVLIPMTPDGSRTPVSGSTPLRGSFEREFKRERRRTFPQGTPSGTTPDGSQGAQSWETHSSTRNLSDGRRESNQGEGDQWIKNGDKRLADMEALIQHKLDLENRAKAKEEAYQQVIRERDLWKGQYKGLQKRYTELLEQNTETEEGPSKMRGFLNQMPSMQRHTTWHGPKLDIISEELEQKLSMCAPIVVIDEYQYGEPLESSPTASSQTAGSSKSEKTEKTEFEPDDECNQLSPSLHSETAIGDEGNGGTGAPTNVQSENAELNKQYVKDLVASNIRLQKQFDELADEAKGLAWVAIEVKPKLERWQSLEDPDKVVRAMDRLHNDIFAMAQAFKENPQELDTYADAPEAADDYPEDMILVRQKVAEILQAGAIRLLDRDTAFEDLELRMREQEQSSQDEIQRLEEALRNAVVQLSYESNEEDPNENDSWEKLYKDNRAAYEELLEKHHKLQNKTDEHQAEYLRLRMELQEQHHQKENEWAEKQTALEEEILECKQETEKGFLASQTEIQKLRTQLEALKEVKQQHAEKEAEWAETKIALESEIRDSKQESQSHSLASQEEVEKLRRQLDAFDELLKALEEDLKAERDRSVRLRRERDEAEIDAKELRQNIKDMRRRSRDTSLLPPFRANNGRRPRYESIEETNWRMGVPLAALVNRQKAEWEVYRREQERLEALRMRKMGKKYPPAQQRWEQLVAMSVDERWCSDDKSVA